MIPKIIHQIAPSDKSSWHPIWKKCHESWLNNFSDFEYKLWNDQEDIDIFMKQHYSKYYNLYRSFPFHIMKIDFVRLCILHHFGGIYADMDVFCYQNFYDNLTEDFYLIENLTNEHVDSTYENSLMIAKKNLSFFEFCMEYSKIWFVEWRNQFQKTSDDWRTDQNSNLVNNITGSGMLSGALVNTKQKVFPLNCKEFNNRAGSYDPSFKTKHIHTSVWGKEYLNEKNKKHFFKKLLIYKGSVWTWAHPQGSPVNDSLWALNPTILEFEEFDFYHDYSNNIFLREDNLEYIKKYIRETQNELRAIF